MAPNTMVRGDRRRLAVAVVGVFVMGTLLPGATLAAKAPPTCSLVPQLRDVAVTQGVGAYTPLVRGKETLVRAYLAKPTCATSGNIIELTGGSLTVTPGTAAAVTVANPTPRPIAPFPQMAAATAAPLVDSTSDPLWVVPGSALAPSNTTARFTATFRITVAYQSKTSSTATPVPGTVTFTTRPGTSTPIAATVEKLTNALRILVVPMGDASQPFASQYTASGDAAVQASMLTVSRIYPLPEGVGSLTGTTGGLRYSVSPGLLDLHGLLGTDGRFCGTGGSTGNFNTIKAALGQFLQSWNAANGAANQADRVLGVVDAAISNGSAQGCAEGMAVINSTEAWVRAVPELQGVPSQTGFVAALELGHTFGLVLGGPSPVPDRDDLFSKYHSPNVWADPLRLNRSYNTRLRSVLVDDRTAMTYIGAANNNNTLLEQLDWAYLVCRFGGATSTECPTQAVPVGSGAGVAAGPRFVISGVTNGTTVGTHVLESFFSTNMLPTPPNPDSPYRLVYRSGPTILANLGLPVQTEDSAHSHDDDGPAAPALTLFSGAFDFQTAATRIELWNGNPGTGVLLYARDRTAAPVLTDLDVTGTTGGVADFTNDLDNLDVAPALSADGQWIAWSSFPAAGAPSDSVIRVAPIGDVAQQVALNDGGDIASTDPAWCADGIRLAYVDPVDGGLWTVSLEIVGTAVSFGTPALVYDATLPGNFPATHPTWSPDCAQLAFEADDDIWRIDANSDNLIALTNDDSSHDPSWSPDPGDNRIAFVVSGPSAFFGGPMFANGDAVMYASYVTPDLDETPVVLEHGGNHFTVTAADDTDDGVCDAHCSLPEAINATNASPNIASTPDEIDFAIPGAGPHTISLTGPLPIIAEALFIEGISQPGWSGTPLIEIDGTAAGPGVDGLTIGAPADISMIRGLAVTGFSGDGIRVFGDDTLIAFSYIGVAPDGSTAKGNGAIGIQVIDADRTIIGINSGVGGQNVISDNGQHGISVNGGSALDPVVGTKIGGNLIGTDAAGTTALGNGAYGIFLNAFTQTALVGGTVAQERNTISANVFGIVVADGADANTIQGNRIGTDSAGIVDLGNSGGGIAIVDADSTTIGGAAAGAGNVISGNGTAIEGADGISITGIQAMNTQIYGNLIGVSAGGLPLGNSTNGIAIDVDSSQGRIGGTGAGEANTIANNGEDGILVAGGNGNTIQANSIHDNGGLGIDIGPDGVTANDTADPDTGANDLQNFPIITLAQSDGLSTIVNGTINTLPNSPIEVDLYASGACDTSANGEGATWLAQEFLMTDGAGDGTFSVPGLGVSQGQVITVTATEGVSNSTSEFSACFTVTGPEAATFTVNATDDTDDGLCGTLHCSLREAINRANATAGFDIIAFDIGGGGSQTIDIASQLPVVTEAVTIDGTTQPGYGGTPLIVVSGPPGVSGLVLNGAPMTGGSTIQGLAIVNFGAFGIEVHGSSDRILDNYLGTTNGTSIAPNGTGLLIGLSADHTEVRGNLISGNVGNGINLDGNDNLILGNRIGTTAAADFDLANGGAGIVVQGGVNQRIGTAAPGDGNVISGNAGPGILVLAQASIQGNKIGTDKNGAFAIANGAGGIEVADGSVGIGGTVPGMGNQISGNIFDGVVVHTTGEASILGNLIGTNAAGTAAIPNSRHGVNVAGGGAANIGGSLSSRNVISGNGAFGVAIADTPGLGLLSSLDWNYIGTNASGTAAVPNSAGGVAVTDAIAVLIGQDTGGNLISGNDGPGIVVVGTSADVEIAGNVIGLNFSSDVPIPNDDAGIYLGAGTNGTIIGGDTDVTPGLGNTISANAFDGIQIDGSDGNTVQGNFIGMTGEGDPAGNGGAGVSVINGGQMNQIGADHSGTTIAGPGNVIAFNGGNGVEFVSGITDANFNSVHSNAIFENGGLGIDLEADGVTTNDLGDGDTGANELINFPDLIEAASDGTDTVGTITTTTAETATRLAFQLFVSNSCDPSGNGEGERYLTTTAEVITDASGFAEAPFSIPEDLDGLSLTATASDVDGQTSEFSECFVVGAASGPDEIHLLDPTSPLGTTEFVVEGSDAEWRTGSLLYETNDEIHRILPDGTGDQAITTGFSDSQPTSGSNATAFVRQQGGDDDIWLILDGSTVNVTATDAVPENLRLDLYYVCGGQSMPIAVGLSPSDTEGSTANFQTNYDPSLSCAGGTIEVALTDGFLRTTTPPGGGAPVASEPKPPVAATYGPPQGSTYLTSDVIPLHGTGEDADDGTLAGGSLHWFIRPLGDPCCGTQVGTGASVDLDAGSRAPGDYIVTLIAVDGDGQTDAAESLIHIVADSDHDGFSDQAEASTCFGAGAATNGSTPSEDADGDGLPNGSDPEPCVAATVYTAIVDVNPMDLNLTSSGTPITVSIQTPSRNISQIIGSSVRIVEIGGAAVNFPSTAWSVSGAIGTAKFSRQQVVTFLRTNGTGAGPVWITVSGSSNTSPAWSFLGRDTTNAKP